jgi:hypothetical protein
MSPHCSVRQVVAALLLSLALGSSAFTQQLLTSRGDNTRSGANTNETLLTPEDVSRGSFGHLWSVPMDYEVLAQPLYVPNVNISGQGLHNVLYVVTQVDSVYAIDADNGTVLWTASMLDGGVPASGQYLPCGKTLGFNQEGIIGTPVIDATANPPTMYLVAKSVFNATVYHYLHALDITTGLDEITPVHIGATSISAKGTVTNFNSLHQKNRPGLLLLNGTLYLGFGSNGCNDNNSGWVLAYDVNSWQQVGVFNTSPDIGHTSIWQTGNGLAADEAGNVFVSTAESNTYDVPNGGQSFSNSVLKLTAAPWTATNPQPFDYFTPSTVVFLNDNDLDVSSVGPLVLPDQTGPATCSQDPCHEVLASGKQGIVYVLDRDQMGRYDAGLGGGDETLQEFQLIAGGNLMSSPAYWNNTVYYTPDAAPVQAFQVAGGVLTPFAQTVNKYVGAHSPSVSSNGTSNGVLWVLSGSNLDAFDAVSLKLLYSSLQSGTRDKIPSLSHFATQTVANGRVYVGTQTTLEAFGLFHVLNIVNGNNQSAQVLTTLPAPLQFTATNPYTGQPDVGITLTFSDGSQGGTFNPPNATTDSNGAASTFYTLGKKAGLYTITVNAPSFGDITANAIGTAAPVSKLAANSGAKQSGTVGTVLPNPLVARARDAYNNPVPGVTITFTAINGGIPNPASAVTNSLGLASTLLTLPPTPGKATVTASAPGVKSVTFAETAVADSGK